MNRIARALSVCAAGVCLTAVTTHAQTSAADSVYQHAKGNRLSIGGYADIALTRNFFSDNVYRYSNPSQHKDDPGHGRFDIPHAVIYLSYDFGKGWSMSSEIEFEHGGAGGAVEQEFDEAGEWEQETEKGGEVELEQLWIQKSFAPWANLRVGHFVVPVGLTNAYHEPLNYFTVYRPEGEGTILPCTWHDTGVSFWGRAGKFRYEVQMVAGLDAFLFDRDHWIQGGAGSPFEFKVANKYGFSGRLDYYAVPGLRFGLSGYYGRSMHNTYPNDKEGEGKQYDKVKGVVAVGAFDFTLNRANWIVRGNADYGYLGDAAAISTAKLNATASNAPAKKLPVGKNAVALEVLRLRPLRVLRLLHTRQEEPARIQLHQPPARGRRSELLPDTADSRQGRVFAPVPQVAVQRRAVGVYRHRLPGLLPVNKDNTNHINNVKTNIYEKVS